MRAQLMDLWLFSVMCQVDEMVDSGGGLGCLNIGKLFEQLAAGIARKPPKQFPGNLHLIP